MKLQWQVNPFIEGRNGSALSPHKHRLDLSMQQVGRTISGATALRTIRQGGLCPLFAAACPLSPGLTCDAAGAGAGLLPHGQEQDRFAGKGKMESEMVKSGEEMPVRLVVATDAHMQAVGKRNDQRGAGENTVDLFDAEHARRRLELAAAETNARRVVIDYRPGNVADAIDKLVYIAAFLISGRTTLAKDEMIRVLKSVENLD